MIAAVKDVTPIAPSDEDGKLIGEECNQMGVAAIPAGDYNLCMSVTNAVYATTTEVYPDSEKNPVTEEVCNQAQVTCATSGLDWIVANAL